VPTGLTAASGSNAFVNLQWNTSAGATSYNVKRATSNAGYYTVVATVSGPNYSDTGLVNGLAYYYKVAAVGSGGPSADSAAVSATPNGPPPIPVGLAAVPDTFERIDLA
jgi:cellulose 1,4-beta-cellobiosidase